MTNRSASLADLHHVITMMANDLDTFCRDHGVSYYLMGGTALGAVRHKGFIPWDDDFDVFMDRVNYLRFLEVCRIFLDTGKYYLQKENTEEWPLFFSKLRLNQTKYVEREDDILTGHKGIYIDVMCLHNVYSNRVMRYAQYLAARVLSATALMRMGYQTSSLAKKLALIGARVMACPAFKSCLLAIVRSLDGCDTGLVGHFFGRAPFEATSFPRSLLGRPRLVEFEGISLPVPEKVEEYLTVRFGPDFMSLPNQKTRDSFPSHLISVDLGPYG